MGIDYTFHVGEESIEEYNARIAREQKEQKKSDKNEKENRKDININNIGALEPGARGNKVEKLQDFLISKGYMTEAQKATGPGIYGPRTEAAVKELQKDYGVDTAGYAGYFGPKTISAIKGETPPPTEDTPPQPEGPTQDSGTKEDIQQPEESTRDSGAKEDTKRTVLTPGEQEEYFRTQDTATDPMSPSEWLANKMGRGDSDSTSSDIDTGGETGDTIRDTTSRKNFHGYVNPDWDLTEVGVSQIESVKESATESGLISTQFLDQMDGQEQSQLFAFYARAINSESGGYTTGDVLNDLKRRELIWKGNDELKDLKIIDPELNRQTYYSSTEGQNAKVRASSDIPTFSLQGLDPKVLEYGTNIPDELFKTLVPLLDVESQEFKDAVSEVKTSFFDIVNKQIQAETEQDKAVADYNYEKFKEQINEQYNIALSDDATKAWTQIENLDKTFSSRGIQRSGLHMEEIDETLRKTRRQDQRLRQEKLTKEEAQMASKYATSATPEEIQALIDEDKAKGLSRDEWRATKWGLVPSEEIKDFYSLERLKKENPDVDEQILKDYINTIIDENGNYRSAVYRKYYGGIKESDIAKKEYAESKVISDALDAEKKAYRPYSKTALGDFSSLTDADKKVLEDTYGDQYENQYTDKSKTGSTKDTSSSSKDYNYKPTDQVPSHLSDQMKAAQDAIENIRNKMSSSGRYSTKSYTPTKADKVFSGSKPTVDSKLDFEPIDYTLQTGEGISAYRSRIAREREKRK